MELQRRLIDACLDENVPFFRQSPGTFLIRARDVPAVLARVLKPGITLAGLEGFELDGASVWPQLDLMLNAAGHPDVDPVKFIRKWGDDIWVHIALSERPGDIGER
jgi:hypothetical protein